MISALLILHLSGEYKKQVNEQTANRGKCFGNDSQGLGQRRGGHVLTLQNVGQGGPTGWEGASHMKNREECVCVLEVETAGAKAVS